MSGTPYRHRFTRFNMTVYVEDRIEKLEDQLGRRPHCDATRASLEELERLLKYWKLEKL